MTSQYVPTATNMVTVVRNILQGYGMGAMRALAQEPVQNSKDASRGSPVHVEYRLHKRQSATDGADSYMLTVTDSNTTGLQGPVLTFDDIQSRVNGLGTDENWAAFEGLGFSKDSSDALGSRGQGKAAFLYHSNLPKTGPSGLDRMIMLYDTLLSDGEYCLGVRFANPFDTIRQPPLYGDEACSAVSDQYDTEDGIAISLSLNPLTQVGARIIVPHLSQEAVSAIHSGELHEWLQRCWWRAIQIGELTIDVVDEHGVSRSVSVPAWWKDEPWIGNQGTNIRIDENITVGQGLMIKRIVLLYDETLDIPDIEDVSSQFWGVQLLRGQQWIETLGAKELLSDYIPRAKRPGFRGFVEFDRKLEHVLRDAESSQHDKFDRRSTGVKPAISAIEQRVEEFAQAQGWTSQESTQPASGAEKDTAMEFLHFLSPRARGKKASNGQTPEIGSQLRLEPAERWGCELFLDFPDPKSTRINWGQRIRNVAIRVALQPTQGPPRRAKVSLTLTQADSKASTDTIATQELELLDGKGVAQFGDFQIITGARKPGKIQCAEPGKWRLTARVESAGAKVTQAVPFAISVCPHQRPLRRGR